MTYIDTNDMAVPPSSPMIKAPAPLAKQSPPARTAALQSQNGFKPISTIPPAASAVAEILETPLGRGMTSGYFSALGEGKTLRNDIRDYYFQLLEKINNSWWEKAATLTETARQDGAVEVLIGRNGELYDFQLQQSTGSREVDLAIMETLKNGAPYPALPPGYDLNVFRAPLRIAAPLRLFSVKRPRQ